MPWGDGGKKVKYLLCFAFFLLLLPELLVLSWLNDHACYCKIRCLYTASHPCPFGLLLDIFKWASPSDYYLPRRSTAFWLLKSRHFPAFPKVVFCTLNLWLVCTRSILVFFSSDIVLAVCFFWFLFHVFRLSKTYNMYITYFNDIKFLPNITSE